MTALEILNKVEQNGELLTTDLALQAMEEYARQEAIRFAEWKDKNYSLPFPKFVTGDIVTINSKKWHDSLKDSTGYIGSTPHFPKVFYPDMKKYLGQVVNITVLRMVNPHHWYYHIKEDDGQWHWHDYMFVENDNKLTIEQLYEQFKQGGENAIP
jgi:hypothetical protein